MPTPTLYAGQSSGEVFKDLPARLQQTDIDLLYITDRAPETDPESDLPYGLERSRVVSFGSAIVEMGPDLTWRELEMQSSQSDRTVPVNLTLGSVQELGRFPPTPYELEATADGFRYQPATLAEHREARSILMSDIGRRVASSPRGEVVLYVHGFNQRFDQAAFTMAELCHFLGREDVCLFFTWPAGRRGSLLASYGYDRESGEFATYHLKSIIRLAAQTPGVERIHLLAHSRGSDLLLTAYRELVLEFHAAGQNPYEALKIHNLVLFAPDVDADVATQRIVPRAADPDIPTAGAARIDAPINRTSGGITVYGSPGDRALSASSLLFRSRRLGKGQLGEIPEEQLAFWNKLDLVYFIKVPRLTSDTLGHGYFVANPAVSGDLVSLIRYDRRPGDPGRPLIPVAPPLVWTFE